MHARRLPPRLYLDVAGGGPHVTAAVAAIADVAARGLYHRAADHLVDPDVAGSRSWPPAGPPVRSR